MKKSITIAVLGVVLAVPGFAAVKHHQKHQVKAPQPVATSTQPKSEGAPIPTCQPGHCQQPNC